MERAIEVLGPWAPWGAVTVLAVGLCTGLLKVAADFLRAMTADRRSRVEEALIMAEVDRQGRQKLQELQQYNRQLETELIRCSAELKAIQRAVEQNPTPESAEEALGKLVDLRVRLARAM